jgi:diadenosine tetraphosphate (Ap4A) HIT family hydrolase
VARTPHAVAVPSIGAFVRGYLLVVPTRHTTSIGQLPRADRIAVATLTAQVADTLRRVYASPVLGFEYGLNVPGARRIEHSHLHLLPTRAGPALRQHLRWHLPLVEVPTMEHLPTDTARSYISLYEPGQPLSIYPVANNASPRIRLRELLARLDPRIPAHGWDWQDHPCPQLMRATIDDLSATRPDATTPGVQRR